MFTVPHDVSGGPDTLAETFNRFVPDSAIERFGDPKTFRWSGKLACANGRSLWRVASNNEWTFKTAPDHSPFVAVALPETGALKMVERGVEYITKPGQAILLHIPEMRKMYALPGKRHARTTLKWSIAEAERALSSISDEVCVADLRQCPPLDLDNESGMVLQRLLSAIAIDLANPQSCSHLASELMNEAALRLLFEPALASPNGRLGAGASPALPRHVKQAIDYMRAHAGKPIRIRDIADACCVTPRSLEIGFRAFTGKTPVAYLRQLRLEAVRRELEAADHPIRISAVARRWGFSDLGRFAERYRRSFGELPSQTQRKS